MLRHTFMGSEELHSLTRKLSVNPSFFREAEEETMRDLVLDYTAGLLDPTVEQEVRKLIGSDTIMAAIWKDFNDIDARLRSPAGQDWMKSAGERILSNVQKGIPREARPHQRAEFELARAYFNGLSKWMERLFSSLTLQSDYSNTPTRRVEYRFDDPTGSPYRSRLVLDDDGQWRLLVFTSNADAAKVKVRLTIEAKEPVLSFVAGEPGQFLAEVLITEEMALALQSGYHRPAFAPVE